MILEVANRQDFENIKIFVNGSKILDQKNIKLATVDINAPCCIKIEFFPLKIKPLVRIDNFLLNYWLADITLYDHCVEFEVPEDFFDRYRNKDIQGRLAHIPNDQKKDHYLDKYIGIDNLYPDLVNEIKKMLK